MLTMYSVLRSTRTMRALATPLLFPPHPLASLPLPLAHVRLSRNSRLHPAFPVSNIRPHDHSPHYCRRLRLLDERHFPLFAREGYRRNQSRCRNQGLKTSRGTLVKSTKKRRSSSESTTSRTTRINGRIQVICSGMTWGISRPRRVRPRRRRRSTRCVITHIK